MELITIVRRLWLRRTLVAVGLVLSMLVGIAMAFRVTAGFPPTFESRRYQVGIASAGMLVDSTNSQVIDLGGGLNRADIGSLSARARLLANLVTTSPLKDRIAARGGVRPDRLVALPPSDALEAAPSQIETGTTVRRSDPDANVLTVQVNETLPIITANTQAPSAVGAARLATAAVVELTEYLRQAAENGSVPYARRLVVKPLGSARSAQVARGSQRRFAAVAVLLLFGLWCLGILGAAEFARGWRQLAEVEMADAATGNRRPMSGPVGDHRLTAVETVAHEETGRAPPGRPATDDGDGVAPDDAPKLPRRPFRRRGGMVA